MLQRWGPKSNNSIPQLKLPWITLNCIKLRVEDCLQFFNLIFTRALICCTIFTLFKNPLYILIWFSSSLSSPRFLLLPSQTIPTFNVRQQPTEAMAPGKPYTHKGKQLDLVDYALSTFLITGLLGLKPSRSGLHQECTEPLQLKWSHSELAWALSLMPGVFIW